MSLHRVIDERSQIVYNFCDNTIQSWTLDRVREWWTYFARYMAISMLENVMSEKETRQIAKGGRKSDQKKQKNHVWLWKIKIQTPNLLLQLQQYLFCPWLQYLSSIITWSPIPSSDLMCAHTIWSNVRSYIPSDLMCAHILTSLFHKQINTHSRFLTELLKDQILKTQLSS